MTIHLNSLFRKLVQGNDAAMHGNNNNNNNKNNKFLD